MRVGKHGPCQPERLVEADCTYEERECLGESDGVNGDVEVHGDGERDEECETGGGEDGEGEPEGGAESARAGEEEVEGYVH